MSEIQPFSNGTEFHCWISANCDKCEKYYSNLDENGYSTCEVENGIAEGTISGTVSEEIAIRMGMKQRDDLYWVHYRNCTEFVPPIRWHIIGELNGKRETMFGSFNTIEEAECKLKVAPLIIKEVAPYTTLNLDNVQLSIEQTDNNARGKIDLFIEQLTQWQVFAVRHHIQVKSNMINSCCFLPRFINNHARQFIKNYLCFL